MGAIENHQRKMNDLIAKAFAAIRNAPASEDSEIYRALVADGVENKVAARLVEFLPMVCARLTLAGSGVEFSDRYLRRQADGTVSAERRLSSEPIWNAAMAYVRHELECNVAHDNLVVVARRSAEFDGVNRLVNKGSQLKDVVLGPALLPWPDDGLGD